MKTLLITTILALSLTGCATYKTSVRGEEIDLSKIELIDPGATTRGEVIELFGKETSSKSKGGIETLEFIYEKKRVPTYLGGMIVSEAGSKKVRTELVITIDTEKDVVKTYHFNSSGDE